MEIPEQLRDWRFILVKPRSKEAFERSWQTAANYAHDDPALLSHLKAGGNYGILAGQHVIIETDTPELERLVEQELPPTFSQRSPGHHSKHFFFDGNSKIIPLFDRSRPRGSDNVGHVKSGPSYVLGPGSVHPNGGRYEVVDDQPVASITDEQVHRVLAQFIARRGLASERAEARKYHAPDTFNILDLTGGLGLKERAGQLQGSHPVHGSETGMNFSVSPSDNVWHCFRCHSGGGPYLLLAVLERILDCQDAGPGALRGELFKRVRDIALDKGLVKKPTPVFTTTDAKPSLTEDAEPHEVAEAILTTLPIHTIFNGETYTYAEGAYRPGGEAVIRRIVESNFHKAGVDKTASNHFLNEVLGHVQRRTYTDPDIFDPDPNILCLENGLLNVDTFEVGQHTSAYPALAKMPVKFDPTAKCLRWEKFLGEVLHPDDLASVQEFIGSLLWKGYETQKAWLQVGEGANGKDTLDRVLVTLLGPENVSTRALQDLENNRFSKAELHGKLANIYSDLPDVALKTTGTFKTLTGQGALSAERKFQNAFSFSNYAKLVFSCNKLPLSPDDSDAFFRRWHITVFPHQFLGENADPNLLEKLTAPEELSGILNWALEGLKRLRSQTWRLSNSKSVEEIRDDYTRKSDPVKAFVLDCCLADAQGRVAKDELFQAFVKYCELNKLPAVQRDTFYKRLPMAGVPISSARVGPRGDRQRVFIGLFLRRPLKWGTDPEEEESSSTSTLEGKPLDALDTLDTTVGGISETPYSVSNVSNVSGGLPPKPEVGKCAICRNERPLRADREGVWLVCQPCYDDQPRPKRGEDP